MIVDVGEQKSKEPLLEREEEIKNEQEVKVEKKVVINDVDLYARSNFLSKLLFCWPTGIMNRARHTLLKLEDLGGVSGDNDAKNYLPLMKHFWKDKAYKEKKKNGLISMIFRAHLWKIIMVVLLSFLIAGLEFFSILIIKKYIDYFEHPIERYYTLFQLGVALVVSKFISILIMRQLNLTQTTLAFKSSLELSTFVFDKVLKASPSGYGPRSNQGEIINFLQVDAPKLANTISMTPLLFVLPIQIGIYIYMLFNFFGISFLCGILVLVISFLINFRIFALYRILSKEGLEKKDKRMKVTTETFDSLKLLKLYNWENEFKKRIMEARDEEIAVGRRMLNITTLNITLYWGAPVLTTLVTIGVYIFTHEVMSISDILIGLTIFNLLQNSVRDLPIAINSILETLVSMNRIEVFIRQEEIDKSNVKEEVENLNDGQAQDISIKISNANFTWGTISDNNNNNSSLNSGVKKVENPEENEKLNKTENNNINSVSGTESILDQLSNSFITSNNQSKDNNDQKTSKAILKNINLEIKKGETVGIIGEVSSGKSSLLQAILNNLILLKGDDNNQQNNNLSTEPEIIINGTTAYVSQIPWIQNETIRNNILFFNEYTSDKYQKVTEVCQLQHDISSFEAGDQTEIGEKGINLSGGQKARVSLARAVYAERDIYLLDDPISALDAHVGKKIMSECILKHLKGKTVLLVTHALQYMKYMDKIIYISKGEVAWTGNYKELKHAPFFKELSQKLHSEEEKLGRGKSQDLEEVNLIESAGENSEENNQKPQQHVGSKSETTQVKRITVDEETEEGEVKLSVYLTYFRYMGGVMFILMIFIIMFLWQVNKAGSDYWLAFWSKKENQQEEKKWVFLGIYSALAGGSIIFIFFRIFLLSRSTIKLAYRIHKEMIENLVKAPINLFHDTVQRGQIYNRLSKDLEKILFLMFYYGSSFVSIFSFIGSIVMCSIFYIWSLCFLPVFLLFGYLVVKFYIRGGRNLNRLDAVSRSPMLNTLSESISGAITIRAFKLENFYLTKFYEKVNNVFKVNLFMSGCSNWFGMQIDIISLMFIIFLTIIIYQFSGKFDPQSMGLILTYSLALKDRLFEMLISMTEIENNMVSMERCLQYCKLPQEKEFEVEGDRELIKQNWPSNGKIEFVDYSVKYRPNTEIVLKNLNVTIQPGEKIGIVGRTGSGKSTICLCLFRILEPFNGTINIDDVDITKVGLNLLRQKLTIIPQDPSLMKGTLRYNIDPFNSYSDGEINNVLDLVGFNVTSRTEEGLEKMIAEFGDNLSVGEKQLICIARAFLRKSKIVIMDEATASIDIKTEEIIQNAIHNLFSNATVLTIAHRIKTILNYDKILVMKDGFVKEFDSPQKLIDDKNSMFYELYSKSSL